MPVRGVIMLCRSTEFSNGDHMRLRIFGAFVACAVLTIGAAPTTAPSTKPTTKPASATTFPSPAELIKQWKQSQKEQDALPKVAYIDLSGPITEKPPPFSFF